MGEYKQKLHAPMGVLVRSDVSGDEMIWILEKRMIGTVEWGVDYETAPRASLRDAERLGLETPSSWARYEFRWRRYIPENEELRKAVEWIDLVIGWNQRGQIEREAVHVALCSAKESISRAKLRLGPPQPPKTKEHPVA